MANGTQISPDTFARVRQFLGLDEGAPIRDPQTEDSCLDTPFPEHWQTGLHKLYDCMVAGQTADQAVTSGAVSSEFLRHLCDCPDFRFSMAQIFHNRMTPDEYSDDD